MRRFQNEAGLTGKGQGIGKGDRLSKGKKPQRISGLTQLNQGEILCPVDQEGGGRQSLEEHAIRRRGAILARRGAVDLVMKVKRSDSPGRVLLCSRTKGGGIMIGKEISIFIKKKQKRTGRKRENASRPAKYSHTIEKRVVSSPCKKTIKGEGETCSPPAKNPLI